MNSRYINSHLRLYLPTHCFVFLTLIKHNYHLANVTGIEHKHIATLIFMASKEVGEGEWHRNQGVLCDDNSTHLEDSKLPSLLVGARRGKHAKRRSDSACSSIVMACFIYLCMASRTS